MKKVLMAALMVFSAHAAFAEGEGGWETGGYTGGGTVNNDYGCVVGGGQEGYDTGGANCRPESRAISWNMNRYSTGTVYPTSEIAGAHCRYNESVFPAYDVVNGQWQLIGYVCLSNGGGGSGGR